MDSALNSEQKRVIAEELQRFLDDELDVSLGTFEAQDLTDFVVDKIGPWLYNKGVMDARAKLKMLAEGLEDELALLEKSSPLDR